MNMKLKAMAAIAAVFSLFIVGCDKLPTVEKISSVSTVIGRTAGYVCNLPTVKHKVKDVVVSVIDVVSTAVPTNGQTFTEAWTPVIDAELKKFVDAGKINNTEAKIAKVALSAATEGIDYVFVKYPKAKDVKELVSAAVTGFTTGYKSVVKLAADAKPEIDEEAYTYLKEKLEASGK